MSFNQDTEECVWLQLCDMDMLHKVISTHLVIAVCIICCGYSAQKFIIST